MNRHYNIPTFIVDTTGIDNQNLTGAIREQFYAQFPTAKEALLFVTHGFNMLMYNAGENGSYSYNLVIPKNVGAAYDNSTSGLGITFQATLGMATQIISIEYRDGFPFIDDGGEGGGGGEGSV